MHLLQVVIDWSTRPGVLGVLLGMSFLSFVASVVGVPWYLRQLPADYLSRPADSLRPAAPRSLARTVLVILKNAVGATLVLAGVAMLVLPGQGLATILVGLLMMDFPQKKRIQRRVLGIPALLRAVNVVRRRMGQPPLVVLSETH